MMSLSTLTCRTVKVYILRKTCPKFIVSIKQNDNEQHVLFWYLAQSREEKAHQNLRCSHTHCTDVDKGPGRIPGLKTYRILI